MTKTMHTYRGYVFTMEFEPNPSGYIVDFPDFPDVITSGSTPTQAFANAGEALDLYLETLELQGRKPPEPRHRLILESSNAS